MTDTLLHTYPHNQVILQLGISRRSLLWTLERSRTNGQPYLYPSPHSKQTIATPNAPVLYVDAAANQAYFLQQSQLKVLHLEDRTARILSQDYHVRILRSGGLNHLLGFDQTSNSLVKMDKKSGDHQEILHFDIEPLNIAEIVSIEDNQTMCCLETKENFMTDLPIYSQTYWCAVDLEEKAVFWKLYRQDSKFYTNLQFLDHNLFVLGSHKYSTNSQSLDLFDLRCRARTVCCLVNSLEQNHETRLTLSKILNDWSILSIRELSYMKTQLFMSDIRKPAVEAWSSKHYSTLSGIFPVARTEDRSMYGEETQEREVYLTQLVRPGNTLKTQLLSTIIPK